MDQAGVFDALGISCERCEKRPGLKDCLGCGYPPTETDHSTMAGWNWGRSPAEHVRAGESPFRDLGVGDFRLDWPWCPKWFWAFGDALIDGMPAYTSIFRAHLYREKGALMGLIPPPWTPALIEGLQILDRLDYEWWQVEKKRREKKRGS